MSISTTCEPNLTNIIILCLGAFRSRIDDSSLSMDTLIMLVFMATSTLKPDLHIQALSEKVVSHATIIQTIHVLDNTFY